MSSVLPLFKSLCCKKGSDNTCLINTGQWDKSDLHMYIFFNYLFLFIPSIKPLGQTEIRISLYEILRFTFVKY